MSTEIQLSRITFGLQHSNRQASDISSATLLLWHAPHVSCHPLAICDFPFSVDQLDCPLAFVPELDPDSQGRYSITDHSPVPYYMNSITTNLLHSTLYTLIHHSMLVIMQDFIVLTYSNAPIFKDDKSQPRWYSIYFKATEFVNCLFLLYLMTPSIVSALSAKYQTAH